MQIKLYPLVALYLLATFLATACVARNASAQSTNNPNVLLIIADDLGVDALDLYGLASAVADTRTIDALAEQGLLFRNVWSNPVCSPTRATILTGRYSFRTGIGDAVTTNGRGIDPEEFTLPLALEGSSYQHANIGKWHLGIMPDSRPKAMGWGYYESSLGGEICCSPTSVNKSVPCFCRTRNFRVSRLSHCGLHICQITGV